VWRAFAEPYEVVLFDRPAAESHGRLRFARRSQPIGERDLLIAGTALAHGLAVVTHHAREFRRVGRTRAPYRRGDLSGDALGPGEIERESWCRSVAVAAPYCRRASAISG